MTPPHEFEMSEDFLHVLKKSTKVVVLTGAGISAESGIPTFRGKEGLWHNFRAEELATPEAFNRDPVRVWEWYRWRREKISSSGPNAAHIALADMEDLFDDFTLITQNVDGLHSRAGSRNILELHGNIWRVRCSAGCGKFEMIEINELPPKCRCGALLRPDVVWFGESLDQRVIGKAAEISAISELFLSVGTSAVVYPAAE
ncbi:MAG: NAD-dependent deacylase, partial [Thermoplasmata archaeon]|nr:NAD-dependent deacylase [Thermoplasmata archaeon]